MKNKMILIMVFMLFIIIFPSFVIAKDVNLSINVQKISIDLGTNGNVIINGKVYSGNIETFVETGKKVVIKLKPISGYAVSDVNYPDSSDINYDSSKGEITINNISSNLNLSVNFIESDIETVYKFIEGMNSIYEKENGEDLQFRVNGPLNLFTNVYLNDELIDPSNYTLKEGSTIITLKEEYLNSLPEGKYILRAEYSDGNSCETIFEITKKTNNNIENPEINNPQTYDNISNYIILFIVSIIGIITLIIYKNYIKKMNTNI